MDEDRDIAAWEKEGQNEYLQTYTESDPIFTRFTVAYFSSYSKGRGRKRKHPKEIILVWDHFDGYIRRYRPLEKMPLDTIATEVYGYDETHLGDKLGDDLLKIANRRKRGVK